MRNPRTGLGLLDMQVLRCVEKMPKLASPRAELVEQTRPRNWTRPLDVLRLVEDATGVAPYIAYESLLDLARPWIHHLPLLEFQGMLGSQDGDPAAAAEFVETRLSPLGRLVLSTEDRGIEFPFDLLIGTFHRRGLRPPFHPTRVIEAMRWVTNRGRGAGEFVGRLGHPSYPTTSPATTDLEALAAGRLCELRLTGRVSEWLDGLICIDSLPPQSGPTAMLQLLQNQMLEIAGHDYVDFDPYLLGGLVLDDPEAALWPDRLLLRYASAPEDWNRYLRVLHELDGFVYVGPIQLAPRVLEVAERGIVADEADAVCGVIDELANLIRLG